MSNEPLAVIAGFKVPAFDPGKRTEVTFAWWSWHPNYPYWSESCWSAKTQCAAEELLHHLGDYYFNALVRQEGKNFTVIRTDGPRRPEVWESIAKQERNLKP